MSDIVLMKNRSRQIEFIQTPDNDKVFRLVDRRVKKGLSAVLLGRFGAGKSSIMRELLKKYSNAKLISGVGTVTQVIGEMVGETDIKAWEKQRYINEMRKHPQFVLIDEAHHLAPEIYVWIKDFIEHGSVFILAGLPVLTEKMINSKNSDVLSRFGKIEINRLSVEDIKKALPMFEEKAIKYLHGAAEPRPLFECLEDCLEYAKEKKIELITSDIAEKIWDGDL